MCADGQQKEQTLLRGACMSSQVQKDVLQRGGPMDHGPSSKNRHRLKREARQAILSSEDMGTHSAQRKG